MDPQEIVRRLEPWRERHRRTAWEPITEERDGDLTASKFAGVPWLGDGVWPVCGECDQPLTFFMQLDLAALPAELNGVYGSGLLQLFYCTECDGGYEAFAKEHHTRVVTPIGANTTLVPDDVEQFSPQVIVGWEPMDDYPVWAEIRELGLHITYDFESKPRRMRIESDDPPFVADVVADDLPDEATGEPYGGDKLAGWPFWVQDLEYPNCPRCSERMRLVFQVNSEENVPFMFGDMGVGHITQCPNHLDVVTFAWACT